MACLASTYNTNRATACGHCPGASAPDSHGACCLPSQLDCRGVCHGGGVPDRAGTCCTGAIDCAGVCNGTGVKDYYGVCCPPAEVNCAGECGDEHRVSPAGFCCLGPWDCAGVCPPEDHYLDDGGVCCSRSDTDPCGVCFGNNSCLG